MSTDMERSPFPTPAGRAAQKTDLDEQVVCGGPEDFMTVRRLRMRGTNFEIGRAVGTMARERYGQSAELYRTEPIYGRARRHYFQHNYPIHWERMRGVAAAFGLDPQDDSFDLSAPMYNVGRPLSTAGCSAVSVPPSWTTTGHGYLSRNYDFSIGSMAEVMGVPLSPEDMAKLPPLMSEPYLMEWYPQDGGYASLAIQAADLLPGTFDGMNSAGLVVAILADNEAIGMMGPNLVAAHGRPFTADDLKGLHAHASFPEVLQSITSDATDGSPRGTGSTAGADVRTLWHCVFDQQSGTVAYRFYLGDEMTADGRLQARRSDYLTFALQDESARVR